MALPRTPRLAINTKAASRVPTIAPAVLAAYRRAPARPNCCGSAARARISTGSVPPMRKAGIPTRLKGNSQAARPSCCSSQANGAAAWPRLTVAAMPSTATNNSRAAYSSSGCAMRSAQRPNNRPPSASPAKKPLIPVVIAYTSTPTTSDSCLIHSTW